MTVRCQYAGVDCQFAKIPKRRRDQRLLRNIPQRVVDFVTEVQRAVSVWSDHGFKRIQSAAALPILHRCHAGRHCPRRCHQARFCDGDVRNVRVARCCELNAERLVIGRSRTDRSHDDLELRKTKGALANRIDGRLDVGRSSRRSRIPGDRICVAITDAQNKCATCDVGECHLLHFVAGLAFL